eukprot:6491901-Amphidinium_carterae.2
MRHQDLTSTALGSSGRLRTLTPTSCSSACSSTSGGAPGKAAPSLLFVPCAPPGAPAARYGWPQGPPFCFFPRPKLKVDSAAGASAVLVGASQEPMQQDDKSGRLYYTASGEKLYDRGVQHVRGTVKGASAPIDVKLRVIDIREGLLSVPEIVDRGLNVVFDNEGSYAEHKASGERLLFQREGMSFEMLMHVLPGPFGRQGAEPLPVRQVSQHRGLVLLLLVLPTGRPTIVGSL